MLNISLDQQFSFHQDDDFLYTANALSNFGLYAFSLGLYIPLIKKFKDFEISSILIPNYSTKRIVRAYILFSIGISFLVLFRNSLPGISTLVVAFVKLKWGFLLVTFVYTTTFQESKKLFYVILLIEIFLGFTGFFSSFKDFIVVIVLGLLSVQIQLNYKSLVKFSFIFIIGLLFGLVWTTIKMDFREYLSGGGGQAIVVSKTDAIGELLDAVSNVSFKDMGLATDALIDRISYIEFFSITLRNIPKYMDYEGGNIIKESTLFYFKPRIFFPNKPAIDDSDHTNKYTNLDLMDDGEASHSIGFMTDAYIDFGRVGMMGLLLILGLVMGWCMKILVIKSPNMLWALIYIVPFYFLLSGYSFNMIKVIGNFITYFIPIYFLKNLIFKVFNGYLIKE